jgi:hypothetical protein
MRFCENFLRTALLKLAEVSVFSISYRGWLDGYVFVALLAIGTYTDWMSLLAKFQATNKVYLQLEFVQPDLHSFNFFLILVGFRVEENLQEWSYDLQ